jgi:endo-1,4-beta-xylanase
VTYSATGGTITAGGLYTAGAAAGTFRVIAAQTGGTKVDTSVVTITAVPPTLTQMVLSPTSVTLAPAGTAQFSVAGTWSDGSPSPPAVTYSAPGGTITAGGLYTAGATAGTFRVIATQQGGPKVDTAVVTLTTPRPTALALVTQPAGAVSGQPLTQAPVIELRSAQNQSVLQGGVVVTVSAASGPGTLSGTLTSTTNSQGRATFGGLQINGTGDYTLAFTSSGLAQVTSQNVTVVLPSLRLLAAARGFTMGAGGLSMDPFRADPSYRPVLATQYNAVTFGYVLQFVAVQPAPTQYSFADADEALAFARANGMAFHGHTLVWHNSLPAWITNGTFTRGQLLAVLKDHITTVVGRYRGNIATWDVVNEVMGDNGSSLRNTIWLRTIGPDYIDSAFVWAHRADPAAKLYLNDYSAEAVSPKADSILQLVLGLRARSIPIDGVGFQTHFSVSSPAASSIRANFARFASAGFDIRVSEMDVQVADGAGSAALETQGATYRNVLDACLLVTRCTGFTTWGFTDRYSWIPASFLGFGRALPLDSAYQAKPAFDSLIVRLRRP